MDEELLLEISNELRKLAAIMRVADRFCIESSNMRTARAGDEDEPEGHLLVIMTDSWARSTTLKLEKYAADLDILIEENDTLRSD